MNYIMTLVSLFATDNAVKEYIETHVSQDTQIPVLGGKICMKNHHNTGAMFHLGGNNRSMIAVISLVFSAFVSGIFAAALTTKGHVILKSGLAILLGGAYSNTYDRLKRKYVVDYVSFRFKNTQGKMPEKLKHALEAIVFNISDFGIILGAMLIVVSEIFRNEKKAS